MTSALDALAAIDDLAAKVSARPLDYYRWTPPQRALLDATEARVLLRTGNQLGKTVAGLAEVIYRCLGAHPYKRVRPPPIEAWVITTSWSQSLAIQGKLWSLLPRDAVDPSTDYNVKTGFGGHNPVVEFLNGSVIRIKTSGQGGLKLAGATIHFILADEPLPSSRIYQEADRRLLRTGGALYQTMTPVNAPIEWVRDAAEAGKIRDLHFRMTPENFIPEGSTRPLRIQTETGARVPMDADWIAGQRAMVLSWEEPVILDGEWEFRAVDRVFENFQPDQHVIGRLAQSGVIASGVELMLAVGLDYGEERLRTIGVLAYIDATGAHPRVYVVGEYAPETATTSEMDAEGVIAMLARCGDRWPDLDHAHGDKRYTDARGRITKKSNRDMLGSIEAHLGTRSGLRPRIRGAKRGAGRGRGAVWRGVRWLNEAMIRPGHFYVDARCTWLTHCLQNWRGGEHEPEKDAVDALRYCLTPWILPRRPARSSGVKFYGRR
jgi:hypothetical protein